MILQNFVYLNIKIDSYRFKHETFIPFANCDSCTFLNWHMKAVSFNIDY